MFRRIHEAFEVLREPVEVEEAPPDEIVYVAVRENIPWAFPKQVEIPPRSYYKLPYRNWHFNDDDESMYAEISKDGSIVTVITKDGRRIQYEGRDVDKHTG